MSNPTIYHYYTKDKGYFNLALELLPGLLGILRDIFEYIENFREIGYNSHRLINRETVDRSVL